MTWHRKVQRSNSRDPVALCAEPAIKASSQIHDMIINSYRRQIQANSNLECEYEALKMRIAEIQQRKSLLEDSIRYKQADYEKQIDQQVKDVDYL